MVAYVRLGADGWHWASHSCPSAHQYPVKEWLADIHPKIDVGMVVVEFLVAMADAGLGEALQEDARAVVDEGFLPTQSAINHGRLSPQPFP